MRIGQQARMNRSRNRGRAGRRSRAVSGPRGWLLRLGVTLLWVTPAGTSQALLIDGFDVDQQVSGPDATSGGVSDTVSGSMLGGSREMTVGGPPPEGAATATVGGGTFDLSQSASGQRFVDLSWITSSLDFTEMGTITAFRVGVADVAGSTAVQLTVSSFGGKTSRLSRPRVSTGPVAFAFGDFEPVPGFEAADFTEVVAVTLRLQSFGDGTLANGLVTIPEPATALLLAAGLAALSGRGRRGRGRRAGPAQPSCPAR